MDTDLRKGTEDGGSGAVRREESEAAPRKPAEKEETGMGDLPRCPEGYCFEVGM